MKIPPLFLFTAKKYWYQSPVKVQDAESQTNRGITCVSCCSEFQVFGPAEKDKQRFLGVSQISVELWEVVQS